MAKPKKVNVSAVSKDEDASVLAQPILGHIKLIDIHLVGSNLIRHPEFDQAESAPLQIKSNEAIETVFVESDRIAIAILNLGIEAHCDGKKAANVHAIYRAVYSVDPDYLDDQVAIRAKAFCEANSLAHVWPYWREYLATTCLRMGLPPVLAPLLIVGSRIKK